ncbi:MAG: APC family permease [Candidatus Rokubacteria bacterium]|nr:APC family permease [Candidatus Rokubacteria bacterium]
MWMQALKRSLLGQPIPTTLEKHERLGRATGLAVFASDALSSSAYATEEIFLILILAGTGALHTSLPISLGIAALLAIVVSSYRQTIRAYPSAGGAYIVSRENLGTYPSLVAGAALLTDYVLTVSVSVAAGIAAVTSALPPLYPYRVELCVLGVLGITVANLRGVRESGRLFAIPTYAFVLSYVLMIGWGVLVWLRGGVSATGAPPAPTAGAEDLTLFLALRAFASGCVALTGIEAVSNGVPAFRPPEARNARQVLVMLGIILITLFVGITFLANTFGLVPAEQETINSQLARRVFGGGSLLYYFVQAMTTLILVLAANTSFADFPRLSSFMALDRFMPRQFSNRGDRLAFSNGIIILAVLSALLLVVFSADTHALIPLYAVGVFVSFTLSQTGMVRYWFRERGPRWTARATLNGLGALATGIVTIIIATTKFTHGAWIVILLIPCLVLVLLAIRRHYTDVARQLSIEKVEPHEPPPPTHIVLVLVGDVHRGILGAVRYARAISSSTRGVYVELDSDARRRMEDRWGKWMSGVPLVVLRSPYRSVVGALLDYLDQLQQQVPDLVVTIILPEFVPARWWQHLLHNQTALLIKGALLFRRGVIVTDVPYHLVR